MSRRLNVDRMRRYVARTTPDVLRFTVDPVRSDAEETTRAALDHWGRRMQVKHRQQRPNIWVQVREWPEVANYERVIEAQVRL